MKKYIKTQSVFIGCLLILTVVFSGCNPRNLPYFKQAAKEMDELATKEAKRLIKEDPEYKKIDSVCRQIPLPKDFNLIVMKTVKRTGQGISYFYTSEVDFDTAEKHFRKYFSANRWKVLDHTEIARTDQFTKNGYEVAIYYGNVGNADYSIYCGKLPLDVI